MLPKQSKDWTILMDKRQVIPNQFTEVGSLTDLTGFVNICTEQ